MNLTSTRTVTSIRPPSGGWLLVVLVAVLGLCVVTPGWGGAMAQPVEWTQRAVTGPSARVDHAMAYDSARGVTVLFGGYHANGFFADTWEWDGTSWTQRMVAGPMARAYHAMAYDSARGVTVLLGGYDGIAYFADTWEWNGSSWTQRMVTGPGAGNYGGTMAYDVSRGVAVVGGGYDTWEWDGTNWTLRMVVASPPSRYSHAMVYDAARGVTVLYGGIFGEACTDSPCFLDDTWEWDGTNWTERIGSRPSQDSEVRHGPAMAYDAARGVTVLFAGYIETCSIRCFSYLNSDTWEWDGTNWTQRMVTGPPPPARAGHAMAYDAARGVTVLFGGSNLNGDIADTWELGVTCPADFNGDGFANSQDFFDFLAAFFGGAAAADFNRDGIVNSQDFFDFLAAFFAGCP